MRRLAVIPSDPLVAYKRKGLSSKLKDYYNPLNFFDKVFLLSPLEHEEKREFGMDIIPTRSKQLKRRIRELKVDIVRAYGTYWPCDMACDNKVNGVPVVVSVHDRRPERLHDSIKKADIVFAVSEDSRKLVLSKFNEPDRIWMLPNRVDFNIMRPSPEDGAADLNGQYPFKFKILSVGRRSEEKNLDNLIKALKILGEEYCLISIGGNGDGTDEYMRLAEEQGVIERCYFIGPVENEELSRYFSWADCMCNPSRSEAMSLALIEALACGAVVITSDIAARGVNIEHMKNGAIIKDHENPMAIADMIKAVCNGRKTRETLKSNARRSVEQFEKSRIDKLEVAYYKRILGMKLDKKFIVPFWVAAFWIVDNITGRVLRRITRG